MRQKMTVTRPIEAKCTNPKGRKIALGIGASITRRPDGLYEVDDWQVKTIQPASIAIRTIVFELNPYIAASDLEAV